MSSRRSASDRSAVLAPRFFEKALTTTGLSGLLRENPRQLACETLLASPQGAALLSGRPSRHGHRLQFWGAVGPLPSTGAEQMDF